MRDKIRKSLEATILKFAVPLAICYPAYLLFVWVWSGLMSIPYIGLWLNISSYQPYKDLVTNFPIVEKAGPYALGAAVILLVLNYWRDAIAWASFCFVAFFAAGVRKFVTVINVKYLDEDPDPEHYEAYGQHIARMHIGGMKSWSERVVDPSKDTKQDDLWRWITDQLFVVQRQQAFAIGCIILQPKNDAKIGKAKNPKLPMSEVEVLLRHRKFGAFEKDVWLWPGSRLRGVEADTNITDRLKAEVRNLMGIQIQIASNIPEAVEIESVDSNGDPVKNFINPSPLMIMSQNRQQKNGVPGHIEMLYVGVPVTGDLKDGTNWFTIDQLEKLPKTVVWPDTLEAIKRAAKWYGDEHFPNNHG